MLVQNEKLASLGRLSAGLIHEINNPLNYARQGLGIISRSTKSLPEEERADFADTVKDVEEGVNRVIQIISRPAWKPPAPPTSSITPLT